MNKYDVRGKPCPEPVIITKEALEKENTKFLVICGSQNSKENISKFLAKFNVVFISTEKEDGFYFEIEPKKLSSEKSEDEIKCEITANNMVMIFASDTIGKDEELGTKLAKGFITTLQKTNNFPKKIFFINSGVKLTTSQDEQIIASLQNLIKEGVEIYSCGMCLEHYEISDQLKVGKIGNALDTLNALLESNNTITLG